MDITAALTVATQAIGIAKGLRDIERDLDSASYKAQMAELYSALADIKMALSDAREDLHGKEQKIKELESLIESMKSGEICPICESGRMKLMASKPHHIFGDLGQLERTFTCQNATCGHSESHMFDPRKA